MLQQQVELALSSEISSTSLFLPIIETRMRDHVIGYNKIRNVKIIGIQCDKAVQL